MAKDEPIPEDALLEPVFKDLLKGQKSVYEIPLDTVDTRAWIGKKQVNDHPANKPDALKILPDQPEESLPVRSDLSAQPIIQATQQSSRTPLSEKAFDPEQAYDEWRRKTENEEAHRHSLKARVDNTFSILFSEFSVMFGALFILFVLAIGSMIFRHTP